MHERTWMLKGAFQNKETTIRIQGGFNFEVTAVGTCFSDALGKVSHNLGRKAVEVRKTLCFPELRRVNIASRLDSWIEEEMTFFVWRDPEPEGYLFIYLIPSSTHIFEMDEFLESLLQIAPMAPNLHSWSGSDQGVKDWEVTRVNKNALEVIGQDTKTYLHIGYVGVGANLNQALAGVSQIVR